MKEKSSPFVVWLLIASFLFPSLAVPGRAFGGDIPCESLLKDPDFSQARAAWEHSRAAKDSKDAPGSFKAKSIEYLKENMSGLAPLVLIPVAALTGGNVATTAVASLSLGGGALVLNKAVNTIVDNGREILPPQLVVPMIAASNSLAELGSSQVSALRGDPTADVASTPMGSNLSNLTTVATAALVTLKSRAIKNGIIKKGEKLTPKKIEETIKSMDWKTIRSQMGLGGVFALDSLLFQFGVRPQMKKGNFIPLAGWLTINIPLVYHYFKHTAFSMDARLRLGLENVNAEDLQNLSKKYMEQSQATEEQKASLLQVLNLMQHMKANSETEKIQSSMISAELEDLRSKLAADPAFQKEVEETVDSLNNREVVDLFAAAKIKLNVHDRTPRKVRIRRIVKFIAGIAAVTALAPLFDHSVSLLSQALPYMSKAAASFYILSYVATLGEYFTTLKFMKEGDDTAATKNIADSNALNILVGKLAMGTSFLVYLINH